MSTSGCDEGHQKPVCLHRKAVRVATSFLGETVVHRCWCPECDPNCKTELPVDFTYLCCGGRPGDEPGQGHLYNCAGEAPWPYPGMEPQPRVPASPLRASTVRVARARSQRRLRFRFAPALLAILMPAACIVVVAVLANLPRGPEPYSAADARVCQTWAAQGATVPEGEGWSQVGTLAAPGYAQLTAAEDALNAELGAGASQDLAGQIQQWEADAESSYVIVHGDWGFENFASDRDGITGWCKTNRYPS